MRNLRAWLTVLRLPNFLTIPGDVLGGFFLAGGAVAFSGQLLLLVLAGMLFYAAGLLLNDWADAAVDRLERPDRPVPAGLVSRGAVLIAGLGAIFVALILCFFARQFAVQVGLALAIAIFSYNLLAKNLPIIGPVNMGLCRGLNLLLGAALVAGPDIPPLAWWGGATVTVYIAAVTHLARGEMVGRYRALERWLPAAVLVGAFLVYLPLSPLVEWPGQVAVAGLFAVAAFGAARCAKALPNMRGLPADPGQGPVTPVPALIGKLISLLLPLQAALIVAAADGAAILGIGAGIAALWPLKAWVGRYFYSS